MKDYWCNFGVKRLRITLNDCVQCDIDTDMPKGAYEYCCYRKPYTPQIIEVLQDVVWYLKLLFRNPSSFFCLFAQHGIAPLLGCAVTTCWSSNKKFPRLTYGKFKGFPLRRG